ncbi:hypothetical protein PINS_up020535 [Pythium insidiosum]|nr:hypothetical protein PINS_up020535 [Pythium insidiosum]
MADAAKSKSSKRNFLVEFCVAGVATSARRLLEPDGGRTRARHVWPWTRADGAYRNFAHGFVTICRTEGLRGIQRGLFPAWATRMNARLGLLSHCSGLYGATDPTCYTFRSATSQRPRRLEATHAFASNGNGIAKMYGRVTGMIGRDLPGVHSTSSRPRIQAASSSAKLNAQYAYKGMIDGFVHVLKTEGFFGLYRGVTGAVPRVVMGSAAQLSTYTQAKSMVMATGVQDGVAVQFGASFVSGFAVATAMNPMDVVVNGKGELYSGAGRLHHQDVPGRGHPRVLQGLDRAVLPYRARHTVFTFLFWEKAKAGRDILRLLRMRKV